jgi:8-oxo-dGTP pyrophosphatase MutT (NUDIX family)
MTETFTDSSRAPQRRVRGIIPGRGNSALVIINNRVTPGHPTIMLPGGGMKDGETPLQALSRELVEELGISIPLNDGNSRFILSRTYEFDDPQGGPGQIVELGFFRLDLPGVVPCNMEPDAAVSVSWMTLNEINRLVGDGARDWRIQLGALDALQAVFDPLRAGTVEGGGGREIAREDAPKDPRVKRLPFGPDPTGSGMVPPEGGAVLAQ